MKILEGLLTVNGVDIYKEYNVFWQRIRLVVMQIMTSC